MLQFKDVTARENSLKTIGTVAEFVGVGGYHEPASDKNFGDSNKRVSIRLVNAKGQQTYVNCSVPLSAELRASATKEILKAKLANLASFPILELPQVDEDGNPVMVVDNETGEEKPLILYSISYQGGSDMSATRTMITEDMLKAEAVKRAINFEDLIAI
jgi:hypothetical protein